MGGVLAHRVVFRAPVPSGPPPGSRRQAGITGHAESRLIWDERPLGTPGGGVRRPFLWLPGSGPGPRRVLIFFHGNAEDVGLIEDDLSRLRDFLGLGVLAVEYPGYGLLHDHPEGASIEGMDEAAVHALWFVLTNLKVPAAQVVLHGRSLGGGPALKLAQQARDCYNLHVGAVILQCTFISIRQVAIDYVGTVAAMLVPPWYDNLEALRRLYAGPVGPSVAARWVPLLVLHGEKDTVIPVYHGRTLYAEACNLGHPRVSAAFPELATHNRWDLLREVASPVATFISRHVDGCADHHANYGPWGKPSCGTQAWCFG